MARSQWIATMNALTPFLPDPSSTGADGVCNLADLPPIHRVPTGRRSKPVRRYADGEPVDHAYRGPIPTARKGQPTHKGMAKVPMSDPALAGRTWYIVVTAAQKEMFTTFLLERIGCAVLYPCMLDYRRINRYKRGKDKVLMPLAVRYLFVGFAGEPNWLEIFSWPCVSAVVGVNGHPASVRFSGIADFISANADLVAPDAHKLMPTHREYGLGDTVEVLTGPFADFHAEVETIKGGQATVRLSIFGREQSIAFPLDNLARLGA